MPPESTRPALSGNRSSSSVLGGTDSPASTPPQHANHKAHKHQKHTVGGGRIHARVPSSKGLHKLTKVHGDGSHTDLKKLGQGSSTTNLKKNNSQVSLKRNRSSADVHKKPKSPGPDKPAHAVHFQIGDQDDWEEASSSAASPALSRSHHSSAKASANNSRPDSPADSPLKPLSTSVNGGAGKQTQHATDGKIIAERLLQRTPSHNTTKMSLATATPMGRSPESLSKSHASGDTPKSKDGVISSRFVTGDGTPANDSFTSHSLPHADEVKRARSMGNLARRQNPQDHDGGDDDDAEESALAPRSRKSSTSHAYIPPQQSRTQQKLWLQRASSNIEPQQMTPGVAINALQGIHGGLGGVSLVGASYDGRDPRIKLQLERTGLEYLVVRRHQDPVGKALKRLEKLPGAKERRRIPPPSSSSHSSKKSDAAGGGGRMGLSQSLKERKTTTIGPAGPAQAQGKVNFQGAGRSPGDLDERAEDGDDDGVGALLRTLWEKNFELSASAD